MTCGFCVRQALGKGIQVTGLDLAANLVQQAKSRAATEGLKVEVKQGDAEDLPFADASFDAVMSLIGSMLAPRPELVASEMVESITRREHYQELANLIQATLQNYASKREVDAESLRKVVEGYRRRISPSARTKRTNN
jgi:hypothetical protein